MKNELLNEMIQKQIKTTPNDKKFRYTDLKRLCKHLNSSVFDENQCSIWHGYITNINNTSKGIYINFYFSGKKVALHRLLYINFVGDLSEDEYLKFNCENKGKCCNIRHLKKFKYNTVTKKEKIEIDKDKKIAKTNKQNKQIDTGDVSFILKFD